MGAMVNLTKQRNREELLSKLRQGNGVGADFIFRILI
jgi:hypothetical protein